MQTDIDNDVDASAVDSPKADDRLHTTDLLDRSQPGNEPEPEPPVEEAAMPLLDDASELDRQWQEIQTRFVDEPRRAVEDADALVAEVMRRLVQTFATERERLEGEWHAGDEVSTEDLRVALQRYRSFFQRLLAA